jgi:hypothetical protein
VRYLLLRSRMPDTSRPLSSKTSKDIRCLVSKLAANINTQQPLYQLVDFHRWVTHMELVHALRKSLSSCSTLNCTARPTLKM